MNVVSKNVLENILKEREQRLAITGLRPKKLGGYNNNSIHEFVKKSLRELIADDCTVITGGAQGVDLWAAEVALNNGNELIVAVPFEGQESLWPKIKQEEYFEILNSADFVTYVSEPGFSVEKMQIRNKWMIDNANKVLGIWDYKPGGTANCIQYAKAQGFQEVADLSNESNYQLKIVNPHNA